MATRRVKFQGCGGDDHHDNDDNDDDDDDDDDTTAVATVVCIIPNLEDFTPEDHENLWFSKADYHMCRAEAKVISRESVRLGHSINLDHTYTEKSSAAQAQLQIWVEEGVASRGLERWANKEHGELRQTDQLEAVMAVLEAQDEMLAAVRCGRTADPEKIRKVSIKATKTARHFARMMGKADSYVMAAELGRDLPSSSPVKSSKQRVNVKSSSSSIADSETVSTAATTRTGSVMDSTSRRMSCSTNKSDSVDDDEHGSIIDGINDSRHIGKMASRFRRFGFGKSSSNRQQANKSADARVSRPA
jgi:hypothetical protein